MGCLPDYSNIMEYSIKGYWGAQVKILGFHRRLESFAAIFDHPISVPFDAIITLLLKCNVFIDGSYFRLLIIEIRLL